MNPSEPAPTSPASPAARPTRTAVFVFVGAVVVLLAVDLLSKYAAFSWPQTSLLLHPLVRDETDSRWIVISDEVRLLPTLFHFKLTVNEGAIFGLGQGQRWAFIAISFVAIAFVTWMFRHGGNGRVDRILLAMLLAGILGNLYDRAVYGYVRDMLFMLPEVHWAGTWRLPLVDYPSNATGRLAFPYIFNLADVFLVVGVTILLTRNLLLGPPARHDEPREPTDGKAKQA